MSHERRKYTVTTKQNVKDNILSRRQHIEKIHEWVWTCASKAVHIRMGEHVASSDTINDCNQPAVNHSKRNGQYTLHKDCFYCDIAEWRNIMWFLFPVLYTSPDSPYICHSIFQCTILTQPACQPPLTIKAFQRGILCPLKWAQRFPAHV